MSAMYHIATDADIAGIPTTFPDAFDFIKQCFTFDVKKRPSTDQLLQHTFIRKYCTNDVVQKKRLLEDVSFSDNLLENSDESSNGSFEISDNEKDYQETAKQ